MRSFSIIISNSFGSGDGGGGNMEIETTSPQQLEMVFLLSTFFLFSFFNLNSIGVSNGSRLKSLLVHDRIVETVA